MDKEAERQEQAIKSMIVAGHRRGVCDSEGRTVKRPDGRPVARPRNLGPKSVVQRII